MLYANELTGSIPTELGLLSNLEVLFLEENMLSSTIPTELQSLQALEARELDNNQLTGSVDALAFGDSLEHLSLQGENMYLTGTFPIAMCSFEVLNFTCSINLCGCDCDCMDEYNTTSTGGNEEAGLRFLHRQDYVTPFEEEEYHSAA